MICSSTNSTMDLVMEKFIYLSYFRGLISAALEERTVLWKVSGDSAGGQRGCSCLLGNRSFERNVRM